MATIKEDSRTMAKGNEPFLNSTSESPFLTDSACTALFVIYIVVFIAGVCGVIKMSFLLLKMNTLSVTTTAIINLVVIHSLFLVTVPFRLYYYVTNEWVFGLAFCKIVSGMVHFHMYLTFLFYMIFLVIRGLVFFQWKDKVEFYRNFHAVVTSIAVWILAFVTAVLVMWCCYGKSKHYRKDICFRFHEEFQKDSVKAVNYTIIAVMVVLTFILLGLQVYMILKVVKKLSGSVWSHQDFWAQLKSLFFVWIIIFCFLPHHFFRIYFIENMDNQKLNEVNEICLSITSISCLDLFLFVISRSKIVRQKISALSCC